MEVFKINMEEVTKRTRKASTVFDNNSGCIVDNAVMKLIGVKDGYKFTLTSVVSTDETIGNMVKLTIDFTEKYNRAVEYGFAEKFLNKIRVKFAKYENLELLTDNANNNYINFNFTNTEFITSSKLCIKYQKKIGIFTKLLNSVTSYVEKMIANKIKRKQDVAERRAAKLALEKEAADAAITEVVSGNSIVTGEV